MTTVPKNLKVRAKPLDIRNLRLVLSDVAYVTLVAAGRVDVDAAKLNDAFSRLLAWRGRVVGELSERLLSENHASDSSLSHAGEVNEDGSP